MNLWPRRNIITVVVLAIVILIAAGLNYRIFRHIVEKSIEAQQEDLVV